MYIQKNCLAYNYILAIFRIRNHKNEKKIKNLKERFGGGGFNSRS